MKIFDVSQLAEADKITVENQGITSLELMERAAGEVFKIIDSRMKGAQVPIKIFCGIGNNGGDGLVIARLMIKKGYNVTVYVVNYSDKRSKNFLDNYDKIKDVTKRWPILLTEEEEFPTLDANDFVIDAIFGIGLNRPLAEWVGRLIDQINKSDVFIISVDMPSGLFLDQPSKKKDHIIKARTTLTFQSPKLVFFLPETGMYAGDVEVLDIGLDREFLINSKASAQLIDKQEAQALYIPRENFSHKGTYGHSLIIGGSYGKIGSICLAATAALRAGAGLVSVLSPECGYQIIQSVLPEAMVITDDEKKYLKNIEFDIEPDVIGFGMGAGKEEATVQAFEKLLKNTKNPMVIDADGLNMLSENKELLKLIPENSVLTPHPVELERMIGKWKNDFEKLKMVKAFGKKHKLVVVVKGFHTITVFDDQVYVNNSGNPGMATAGAGDVLSGVITGLMSQKYDPLLAAVFGVYLHGKTGDLLVETLSYEGLTSMEIAKNLGMGFLDLFKKDPQSPNN